MSRAAPREPSEGSRILIVKLTSLGDVVKALPVVADIHAALPGAQVDWVVERPCDALLEQHAGIDRVIALELRRYRKERRYAAGLRAALRDLRGLRERRYDLIVDLQGRMKSAIVASLARGPVVGPAAGPASEPFYAWLYRRRVPRAAFEGVDAITANRRICAAALGYPAPAGAPHCRLRVHAAPVVVRLPSRRFAVLVHGSSRAGKLWPDVCWIETGRALARQDVRCVLPWGDAAEAQRAHRLAAAIGGDALVPDHAVGLDDWVRMLSAATVVVGVDSGLTHLAAACGAPTIAIFVDTSREVCGIVGEAPHRNLGDAGRTVASEEVIAAIDELLSAVGAAGADIAPEATAQV